MKKNISLHHVFAMKRYIMLGLFFIVNYSAQAQTFTCNAHFTHQFSTGANGVYFSGQTNPTGAIYSWVFGDGGTGSGVNAFHTYALGNYLACLTVTVPASPPNTVSCTATICDSVHITPVIVNCSAHFTQQSGTAINSVHFINPTNPTGTVYAWTFGDGDSSSNVDPTHTYAPGNYLACLTVTAPGTNGTILCTATHCDSVHISPTTATCNAHFTHQFSASANGVYFIGQTNPTGAIYSWTFGDGSTGSGINAFHAYAPGNYLACLTVTVPALLNTIGCSTTICDSIHVSSTTVICSAAFTQQPGTAINGVHFINPTNPVGTIYAWTFGDGGSSSNVDPTHTYAPGNYLACLTVTVPGTNGAILCTATHCDSVHISPATISCNGHFTHLFSTGANGVYFIGQTNPAGAIYSWTFGDGGTGSGINAFHAYAPGNYLACLTVTVPALPPNTFSCTSTFCDSIHVGANVTCNAHYTHQPATALNSIYFISQTNPAGTQYLWSFGDGGTSTNINAVHTYLPGNYFACLTVTVPSNSSGTPPLCTATFCDSIHIANVANCVANFSYQHLSTPLTYGFTNQSSQNATGFFWHFGDATTSTMANPVHQYATAGIHQVCLTMFDTIHHCSNTKCITISASIVLSNTLNVLRNGNPDLNDAATDALSVNVYPNPTTQNAIVHIENARSPVIFNMYDNTGKIAERREQLSNGDFELNNNNHAAGIYYYQVISEDNNVVSGKLIIQK